MSFGAKLVLLCFFTLVYSSCPKYVCEKPPKNYCYNSKTEGDITTFMLAVCPNGNFCSIDEFPGTCKVNSSSKYPGEYCEKHGDCISSKCTAKKCAPKTNDICTADSDCDVGKYCKLQEKSVEGICKDLLTENCTKEDKCIVGHVCSNGTCVKMGSVSKNGYGVPSACETYYSDKGKCLDSPKFLNQNGNNCTYKSGDYEFILPSECQMNDNPEKVCHPGIGDVDYFNEVLSLKNLVFAIYKKP